MPGNRCPPDSAETLPLCFQGVDASSHMLLLPNAIRVPVLIILLITLALRQRVWGLDVFGQSEAFFRLPRRPW